MAGPNIHLGCQAYSPPGNWIATYRDRDMAVSQYHHHQYVCRQRQDAALSGFFGPWRVTLQWNDLFMR